MGHQFIVEALWWSALSRTRDRDEVTHGPGRRVLGSDPDGAEVPSQIEVQYRHDAQAPGIHVARDDATAPPALMASSTSHCDVNKEGNRWTVPVSLSPDVSGSIGRSPTSG
ncbi:MULTISPECIES: hypothetical protein [Nocardioides]|uniref:hypothetical protein n=1 Tax=Nocardioides TaxID=1839 RepID=UPI0013EA7600|nr:MULTISPECIES: hypothetical protein [Nocardioides]